MEQRLKLFFSEVKLVIRSTAHSAVAEFLGTFVLIVIGIGSIAQSELTGKGGYATITWGWALGCTLGITIAANVSGGHINPAVTMALAFNRSFPWKKLPVYWFAQYLGAITASATVFGIYYDSIMHKLKEDFNGEFRIAVDETNPGYAGIFANYPSSYATVGTALLEEILATAIFMIVILVVTDKKMSTIPTFLQPIYIGLTLLAVGVAYGANCGYALNPARDLGPRLITSMLISYRVFSFRGYNWFWIFILGPHLGALLGAIIFNLYVKANRWEPAKEIASSSFSELGNIKPTQSPNVAVRA